MMFNQLMAVLYGLSQEYISYLYFYQLLHFAETVVVMVALGGVPLYAIKRYWDFENKRQGK